MSVKSHGTQTSNHPRPPQIGVESVGQGLKQHQTRKLRQPHEPAAPGRGRCGERKHLVFNVGQYARMQARMYQCMYECTKECMFACTCQSLCMHVCAHTEAVGCLLLRH